MTVGSDIKHKQNNQSVTDRDGQVGRCIQVQVQQGNLSAASACWCGSEKKSSFGSRRMRPGATSCNHVWNLADLLGDHMDQFDDLDHVEEPEEDQVLADSDDRTMVEITIDSGAADAVAP